MLFVAACVLTSAVLPYPAHDDAVEVRLVSDQPVTLYQPDHEHMMWAERPLCSSPCVTHIPAERRTWLYNVQGRDVSDSPAFSLEGPGNVITLHVNTGQRVLKRLGVAAIIIGAVGAAAGLFTFGIASLAWSAPTAPREGLLFPAGIVMGVGLVAVAVGVVMVIVNRTSVAVSHHSTVDPVGPSSRSDT